MINQEPGANKSSLNEKRADNSNVWQVNTLAQRVRFFGWPRLTFLYKIYLDGDIRRCPFWRERFERTRSVIYCLIERVLIWRALVSLQKTRLGLNHLPSGCGHGFGMWKKSCLWKVWQLRCLINEPHTDNSTIWTTILDERTRMKWKITEKVTWKWQHWVDNIRRHCSWIREEMFTKTKVKLFQKNANK